MGLLAGIDGWRVTRHEATGEDAALAATFAFGWRGRKLLSWATAGRRRWGHIVRNG
jgi:hypothetical protein